MKLKKFNENFEFDYEDTDPNVDNDRDTTRCDNCGKINYIDRYIKWD